jgi:flagellar biosynthesis GTPase FlhF
MAVLSLCGWQTYQHYTVRSSPWIKLYRDTLTTEAWVLGSDQSRLVQLASMLLALRYDNAIPDIFTLWQKVASLDMSEESFSQAVQHLVAHKFLEIKAESKSASKVLAPRYQDASLEEKKKKNRKEKNKRESATRRAPEDFLIGQAMIEEMRKELPGIDIEAETRKFRDHEFKSAHKDWYAAWRNWLRNAVTLSASRHTNSNGSASPAAEAAWRVMDDEVKRDVPITDPLAQRAVEHIGGRQRVRMRTIVDGPNVKRAFCAAYGEGQ